MCGIVTWMDSHKQNYTRNSFDKIWFELKMFIKWFTVFDTDDGEESRYTLQVLNFYAIQILP